MLTFRKMSYSNPDIIKLASVFVSAYGLLSIISHWLSFTIYQNALQAQFNITPYEGKISPVNMPELGLFWDNAASIGPEPDQCWHITEVRLSTN